MSNSNSQRPSDIAGNNDIFPKDNTLISKDKENITRSLSSTSTQQSIYSPTIENNSQNIATKTASMTSIFPPPPQTQPQSSTMPTAQIIPYKPSALVLQRDTDHVVRLRGGRVKYIRNIDKDKHTNKVITSQYTYVLVDYYIWTFGHESIFFCEITYPIN